ncbi:Glyoxylase [Plasmopara halstedii]|uniref:Glyoxylase n=1 Tax=Plasmopara halstedii TaxID=4781 RepID=A0A0P1AS49_PLAHL|nr:Glyoxylase [Plasmopara halstedii]CEG43713.1 Glyoxylase [Plasmopara halstedii]|eukprot:XP_024580082.1 Glyoxylase [Plasmopara halstedii]
MLWIFGTSHNLPKLADVDQLPGQVLRVLGNNPSRMTLSGTNVYVIGSGSKRLMIDSSDGNRTFERRLLEVLKVHGVEEISDLLVTHGHLDHIGGILQLKKRFPGIRVWKYLPDADKEGCRRLSLSNVESQQLGIKALVEGQTFRVPGSENQLTVVYTPGHCNDHVCFVMNNGEDLKASILFSGDCILGFGSCVFDSLLDLMASLAKLKRCSAIRIYPGHGPVVEDASAKITEYIKHRQQREDEIVKALKLQGELSLSDIMNRIYEPLPFVLRYSARQAIEKHLQKLLIERRVRLIHRAGLFQSATYSLI